MSKENEMAYLGNIGKEGFDHAVGKPYTDLRCGQLFLDIGSIMTLLPAPPAAMLDLGVGTGWTSLFFARRGYMVTGQDIAVDMIRSAEENRDRQNVGNATFLVSDYESLAFREQFDCALFYDSLHHAVNPQDAINAAYRALKKGGVLLTLEPGSGHSRSAAARFAVQKWGVTEKDMPPALVKKLGARAGFTSSKVYLRQNYTPLEILPSLSLRRVVDVAKVVLRFLPIMGNLRSNITVLVKQ